MFAKVGLSPDRIEAEEVLKAKWLRPTGKSGPVH